MSPVLQHRLLEIDKYETHFLKEYSHDLGPYKKEACVLGLQCERKTEITENDQEFNLT